MKPFYAIVGLPITGTSLGFLFGGIPLAILCMILGLVIGAGVAEKPESR